MMIPLSKLFYRHLTLLVAAWLCGGSALLALELKPQVVQERYRVVLETLASSSEVEAMGRLYSLETEAVPPDAGSIQLERFWRLKLRVIRDLLADGKLDQLVPIVVLHHDAFQMYRDRAQPLLAAHSRTMATELAEILVSRAEGNEEVRDFAGWVLTSFGAYLQESSSVSRSASLFDRALRVTPANRSALLGLAAAHEKYGEYAHAVPYLERALENDPADAHSRLRLGLCLLRAGEIEPGKAQLRRLLAEPTPTWIRSLAYQELASQLITDGEAKAAEALLREAIEALPRQQAPRIQLAALVENQGRPAAASEVLAGLAADASGAPSPRYLYDEWPREGVDAGRAKLRAMMQERLGVLAVALRSLPSEELGP